MAGDEALERPDGLGTKTGILYLRPSTFELSTEGVNLQRGLRRASLAAVVLCSLLLPAAGSVAGPKDQLQNTQEELDAIRDRIDVNADRASELKKRINALNRAITKIQIEVNRLDAKVETVQAEVEVAQAQMDETQKEIDRVEELATDQAVALYKSGSTETIDALLEAESLSELTDRVELLGVAAQENTGALVEYGRLHQTIEAQSAVLFDKRNELEAELARRSDFQQQLNVSRVQLSEDLTKLNVKLGGQRNREGDLESAQDEIQQRILQATVETDVASLGKSSRGFIWPLNGGVTSPYGSRWGGMHTGIDIDGYTGQPIVAAKSGNVIYASSSTSGYGNAMIIDHGGGISTLYAHMSEYEITGGSVDQGKIIGYVGCTGNCYGDHLHFEVRLNGNPVDPMRYLP
ncbi:MAG: peptidoglycan DD-metalloendopeptidase family protein [Actinomycetota bacterium]|nr:peptidoglycan DD-metalloendopeptidase family protein [Actinomycetota bacterium]